MVESVVAWIGAELEFALSQAVASGDTFEHRPSECGHCVQDFLADLDLRDLPGEAAGSESGADDALPPADLRFYPAALVVPCGHLPGHAAVAADLGNMAIPNGWIPRRLRADHCVLWRRYNHIQGLPIPFPQQIPCGRSIIGAVRQKARDRGIELIQEPGQGGAVSNVIVSQIGANNRTAMARSSPRWSLRQRRRIPLVLCFCASHSPSPKILRPVLSTTRWTGTDPACLIT